MRTKPPHNTRPIIKWVPVNGADSWSIPYRQYDGDAGLDLTVSRSVEVAPGAFACVPTNIRVAIPKGYWGMLIGRSSTFHKRGLIVNIGVIDSGFRGEVMALVYNPGNTRIIAKKSERLFQLIPMAVANIPLQQVMELPKGERGEAGFGSSGGFAGDE